MGKWRRLQRRQFTTEAIRRDGTPESWRCIDCDVDTAPGCQTAAEIAKEGRIKSTIDARAEVYCVHNHIWSAAGMDGFGGCLCIGCLERRLGRELIPDDFDDMHPFAHLPGTPRLMQRQGRHDPLGDFDQMEHEDTGGDRARGRREPARIKADPRRTYARTIRSRRPGIRSQHAERFQGDPKYRGASKAGIAVVCRKMMQTALGRAAWSRSLSGRKVGRSEVADRFGSNRRRVPDQSGTGDAAAMPFRD
jgi:hypothetical protein